MFSLTKKEQLLEDDLSKKGVTVLLYAPVSNRIQIAGASKLNSVQAGDSLSIPHHSVPSLSPDKQILAYVTSSRPRVESVILQNVRTNMKEEVLTSQGSVWGISFSPDSSRVAIVLERGEKSVPTLLVLDLRTRNHVIANDDRWLSTDCSPSWAPDGNSILLSREVSNPHGVKKKEIISVSLQERRAETEGTCPVWNQDRILYLTGDRRRALSHSPKTGAFNTVYEVPAWSDQMIAGPLLWSRQMDSYVLSVTTGFKGQGHISYLIDRGGNISQLAHERAFQIVDVR